MSQEGFEGMSEDMDDFLEPLDAGFTRPGADDVDDMLDVIARAVDDNGRASRRGSNVSLDFNPSRRGSNISLDLDPIEFEAFTESLEESLAKFDDFLERANANGLGDSEHEQSDKLTELRPIESLREKRSRDQGSLQSGTSPFGSGMTPRIRNISGEKLSSMPAMHHGYATTSSLNQTNAAGASAPQKNQTWDKPEPVLGEVTGNKMRRLLSDKSYFQSRPNTAEASKNAPWNQPKAAPNVNARTAMQTLLYGGSSQATSQTTTPAAAPTAPGWPATNPSGGVTLAQMQFASTGPGFPAQATANPFQTGMQASGVAQATTNSPFASVSLQEMQRLAAAGVQFSSQAAPGTAGTAPQNVAQAQTAPGFASVSLQDIQRLAYAQPAAAASVNVGQNNVQNGGFAVPAPRPAFASVSLQDMQRLAATGATFPAQTAAPAAQAPTPPWAPKPAFATVTLEDMKRLANSLPTTQATTAVSSGSAVPTPPWATQAQKPAAVTMQDMQRLGTQSATSQSYGNMAQAAAASKPVFATVSLEDMQRLAQAAPVTGVSRPTPPAPLANTLSQNAPWNAPKHSAVTASMMGGAQQSTATTASATASSQAPPAVSTSTTPTPASGAPTQQAPPKPTFANVTLEDMQRLVNAYSEHQKPAAPAVPANATTQPVSVAQKPAPMDSTGASTAEFGSAAPMQGVTPASATVGSTNEVHGDDVARKNVAVASSTAVSEPQDDNVICMESDTPPKKVSGGAMQRMLSEASYFQSTTAGPKATGTANAAWPEAIVSNNEDTDKDRPDTDDSDSDESDTQPSDSEEMLKKLKSLMSRSSSTQQALQDFDKKRGLPRSHSQTMVNSSRSRTQLLQGKIIAKWDGSPLISDETELGKPRPRAKKTGDTTQSGSHGNTTGTASTAFAAV